VSTVADSTFVGDLVAEQPGRARLFERLGIDYCCGGRRPLADACLERGLDPTTVAVLLSALPPEGEARPDDWSSAPLADLCDHIVDVHHAFLRRELPRLSELLEKCERAHGDERPDLHETRLTFEALRRELEEHLEEEERNVFPRLAGGERLEPELLPLLESEHEAAGSLLRRLSELTGGYDTGAALCNTHRVTLSSLAELERDLHEHIHEENNILFPRAC
jgi:regulator of cell morphogenesis and NO signaling